MQTATAQPLRLDRRHGAHAVKAFVDRGKRYEVGDSYSIDGLDQLKVDGLLAGSYIALGPASERLLRKVALRKADTAPAVSLPAPELSDAELDAATAPPLRAPPPTRKR